MLYHENLDLASQGSSNCPNGTILPYAGALNKLPYGWYLCDGSNGTPDLRDRFLAGAGASYWPGMTGGEAYHVLSQAELPATAGHINGYVAVGYTGYDWIGSNLPFNPGDYDAWIGAEGGDVGMKTFFKSINSVLSNGGLNQPHENRPPFYAVYYIIKLK